MIPEVLLLMRGEIVVLQLSDIRIKYNCVYFVTKK